MFFYPIQLSKVVQLQTYNMCSVIAKFSQIAVQNRCMQDSVQGQFFVLYFLAVAKKANIALQFIAKTVGDNDF